MFVGSDSLVNIYEAKQSHWATEALFLSSVGGNRRAFLPGCLTEPAWFCAALDDR